MPRLFLSPPHLDPDERTLLMDAIDSNWVAPLGPHVDAFEAEFAAAVGAPFAVALSSGTAALHLALVVAGVGLGDEVLVSSFTFPASVNPICYLRARPVFVDSDRASWNMDPHLLAEALSSRARAGRLPRAVILVSVRAERRHRRGAGAVRRVRGNTHRGYGGGLGCELQGARAGYRWVGRRLFV